MVRYPLLGAVVLAISVRLVVWFGSLLVPIPNEARQPISPLHANSTIDLLFYLASRETYAEWIDRFAAAPLKEWGTILVALGNHLEGNFISGPLMAGLLALFDYGPANPLPLAIVYLLLSCSLVVVWLRWYGHILAPPQAMLILALMPGPLWLMLNVSSDLPFAALLTAFFFVFFSGRRRRDRYVWGAAIALATTLLRPHGISLFLFMGLYAVFMTPDRTKGQKMAMAGILAAMGTVLFLLFASYFEGYLRSSAYLRYFGLQSVDYINGIFTALPDGLNQIASWIALAVAKLLYLVGLRPSYGETSLALVLLRAAPGLVLLPGLLYGLFRAPWAYRLFLFAFFAPIAFGAAQERYMLAVTPLLVLFATRAAQEGRGLVTGKRPVFPPLPLENRA